MTSPLPVLIIGAGLGGLTLAHSLHNRSIPFHIYERDSAAFTRTQGYRINLSETGATGLKHALPEEVYQRFVRTVGREKGPAGRVDARRGRVVGRGPLGIIAAGGAGMVLALLGRYVRGRNWARWVPFSSAWSAKEPLTLPGKGVDAHYPVDRGTLRTILLETLPEECVTFDAPFSSYELADKAVTVRFSNPSISPATGSLLVGADGVSSRVASQLIGPSFGAPLSLDTHVIYGRTPLAPLLEAGLHPQLHEGTGFVTDEEGAAGTEGKRILLVCEAMRFDRETADEALPEEDYFFWALTARKEVFSSAKGEGGEEESPTALSLRLTSSWHPSLRPIFTLASPSSPSLIRLSTSPPFPHSLSWPTNPLVTLLGDAVHAMPPTGGAGANTALWDAALLGMALGRAREEKGEGKGGEGGKGWSVETVREYEEGMRYNVGDIVGLACIGLERLIGAKKVVE